MAEEQHADEPVAGKRGFVMPIVWATVGFIVGAGGFSVPLLFPQLFDTEAGAEMQTREESEPAFINFGEIVVNLNSDRFNRYLKVNITLQVEKHTLEDVSKLVEQNRAILKSWLISCLADKSTEEIRGAAGQNRLRREIQDHFNATLFTDGYDRIHDVLFEEFNVQ